MRSHQDIEYSLCQFLNDSFEEEIYKFRGDMLNLDLG